MRSWDHALERRRPGLLSDIIAEHGPDAVALYVSGQLLTEDYYVANKLMKGFIGSANIDTNSRLCDVVGGGRAQAGAFGEDLVPGNYEDLELALDRGRLGVGLKPTRYHPIASSQRAAAPRKPGPEMKLVVIDPRRTGNVRAGRPAPAGQAGHRCAAVQWPSALPGAARRAGPVASSMPIPAASTPRWPPRARTAPMSPGGSQGLRKLDPEALRALLCVVRRHAERW
ncbi:molybdopterin-dependent oxidoreductase [Cupriavidus basilensis]